jgi:putative methyltransferase
MCYEVLFGKGKIKGGGAVKREVNKYIASLREGLTELMLERMVTEKVDLLPERVTAMARMPTYIRVNNLKLSAQKGLDIVQAVCADARPDEVIPGLIYIPAGASSFGQNAHVKSGELIIQDKASCIPSQTLTDHWEGGDVLDACAAPGNKTSHVASILLRQEARPIPTIIAFDRSKNRSELLRRRLDEAGAQAVRVKNEDFLLADVH